MIFSTAAVAFYTTILLVIRQHLRLSHGNDLTLSAPACLRSGAFTLLPTLSLRLLAGLVAGLLICLLTITAHAADEPPGKGTTTPPTNTPSTTAPKVIGRGLVATPTQCDNQAYFLPYTPGDAPATDIAVGDKIRFIFDCRAPLNTTDPNLRHMDGAKADYYVLKDNNGVTVYRGPNDWFDMTAMTTGSLCVFVSAGITDRGRTSHYPVCASVGPAPVGAPPPTPTCDPTRFEERTQVCAIGFGNYIERRTNQCPSNTYGNWTVVSSNCVTCTANSTYIVASNTCRCNAGYYSDLIAKTCVSTCPTPTVGLSNGSCGCPSGAAYNGTSCVPVCTAGVSNSLIAVGSSISVTAFCTPDATSYTWYASGSPTDNPPPVTGTGRLVTFNTIGTYQYRVAGTNADGTGQKSAPATVTVVNSLTPVCTVSTSATSLAPGGTATIAATCDPVATGYTWVKNSDSAPAIYNTASSTLTFSNPGTYTYYVIGSNGQGTGAASNTVTITVGNSTPPPSPPACMVSASATSLIAGGTSTITATCNPAATSYIWTVGGTGAPTISNSGGTLTFSNPGTYTYQVTGSNGSGTGTASNTATITVQAMVTASINQSTTTTIAGEALTTTWGSTNATSCVLDFSRGGGPFNELTTGLSGMITTYPTYIGTIVVRNTCQGPGGPAVATYTHTVLEPPPVCTVTADPDLQDLSTFTITASCTNSPTSYAWAVSSGGQPITGTGGKLTFPRPGLYSYSVVGTNAGGAGPQSNTVTVEAQCANGGDYDSVLMKCVPLIQCSFPTVRKGRECVPLISSITDKPIIAAFCFTGSEFTDSCTLFNQSFINGVLKFSYETAQINNLGGPDRFCTTTVTYTKKAFFEGDFWVDPNVSAPVCQIYSFRPPLVVISSPFIPINIPSYCSVTNGCTAE